MLKAIFSDKQLLSLKALLIIIAIELHFNSSLKLIAVTLLTLVVNAVVYFYRKKRLSRSGKHP